MSKGNGRLKRTHLLKRNGGTLWLSRSYNVLERDPECDNVTKLFHQTRIKESDLAMVAGCNPSTVRNLLAGKTQQPRHSTFAKLAHAMGKKYGLMDDRPINYEREIPKAREEFKAHQEYLKKKREREARR